MTYLVWLVPIALGMGLVGLAAFLWSMNSDQMEDLDGAAERVLLHQGSDFPAAGPSADSKMTEEPRQTSDRQQERDRT